MPEPKKKSFSFGNCTISKTSPERQDLTGETKILNVAISFEDGLKLSLLAMNACESSIPTIEILKMVNELA